jgi:hypothetical protein
LLLRLEPGARTIALTGVAQNCTADDPSRQVAIAAGQTAALAFAVVCTAATGVIEIIVDASPSSMNGPFEVLVDGDSHDTYSVSPTDVSVPAGPHAVSFGSASDCRVDQPSREVRVTAGGLVRDTVQVRFSVVCHVAAGSAFVRATIRLIGSAPPQAFTVWACNWIDEYYCRYSDHTRLGSLTPGDTLIARVREGVHRAWLENIRAGCGGTTAFHPSAPFIATVGDTVDVVLEAHC